MDQKEASPAEGIGLKGTSLRERERASGEGLTGSHAERPRPNRTSDVQHGYEWVALSVTTIGALLASIQGSALIIGLPDILGSLQADFLAPGLPERAP